MEFKNYCKLHWIGKKLLQTSCFLRSICCKTYSIRFTVYGLRYTVCGSCLSRSLLSSIIKQEARSSQPHRHPSYPILNHTYLTRISRVETKLSQDTISWYQFRVENSNTSFESWTLSEELELKHYHLRKEYSLWITKANAKRRWQYSYNVWKKARVITSHARKIQRLICSAEWM